MTAEPVVAAAVPGPVDRCLVVRALGRPARQGSKDFKGMRRGKPVLVESDGNLPEWRKAVDVAARSAMRARGWLMLNEALTVDAVVWLPRPKTVTREYPTGRQDGDVDKYGRAILDALSLAGVYYDDSLVVDCLVQKRYVTPGQPLGARIVVRPIAGALL